MDVLQDLIVILLSAALVLVLIARLKIPAIIGFLLTGILIGPHAFKVIHTSEEITVLADIGVMLLMFNVGLEFSLEKLKNMKFEVLVLGGLQIFCTIIAVAGSMILFDVPVPAAILASFVLSLSSTAIVLKILQDKTKLQTPAGRIMLGILLFQDICVVPLIILTPTLASFTGSEVFPILFKLFKSFTLIVIIFALAKYLLPKFFDFVINLRINELFMILVLGFCFGLAILTNQLGFSLALGSFIAGMVLAESDYISQIEADTKQLKNVFLSVFFIAVGMLLNIQYIMENTVIVFLGTTGMILLKAFIIILILVITKNPLNIATTAGLGLAQIGEFSFLLLNIAKPIGVITEDFYQYFLAVTIISMLITPALISIGFRFGEFTKFKKSIPKEEKDEPFAQVIIAGFGINGVNLSRIFKALNIGYKIIEINPTTVKKYKKKGENIVFGDITQPENLSLLGIEKTELMVIAISDADATKKAVELSKKMNPGLHVIVRSEFITQIEPLYGKGANIVISQDFEASIEVAAYVLKYFGVANRIIRIQANALRRQHYKFFLHEGQVSHKIKIARLAAIEKFHEIFFILFDSRLIGVTLASLDFSGQGIENKVIVIGIVRGSQIMEPSGTFTVQALDTLVLYGDQRKLHYAISYLENFKNHDQSK